jgi:hypothetical protein
MFLNIRMKLEYLRSEPLDGVHESDEFEMAYDRSSLVGSCAISIIQII